MAYPDHTFDPKDPSAVIVRRIDWSAWLTDHDADTISTSSWAVPSGITKVSDSKTTTTTTIKLSGGTAGTNYDLTNTIVTVGGLTELRTVRQPVALR